MSISKVSDTIESNTPSLSRAFIFYGWLFGVLWLLGAVFMSYHYLSMGADSALVLGGVYEKTKHILFMALILLIIGSILKNVSGVLSVTQKNYITVAVMGGSIISVIVGIALMKYSGDFEPATKLEISASAKLDDCHLKTIAAFHDRGRYVSMYDLSRINHYCEKEEYSSRSLGAALEKMYPPQESKSMSIIRLQQSALSGGN